MSSVRPCPSGCDPPRKNPAANSPATSSTSTGPYAIRPAGVATSTSGSSQHIPRVPLRTTCTASPRAAASRTIAAATSSAPSERAVASIGTNTVVTVVVTRAPAS